MRAEDQPKPKVDDTSVPASGSEPNLSVPASDSGTPKNASFSGSGDSLTPSPAGPDGTPATQMHEPVTPPTDEASLPSSGTPVSPVPFAELSDAPKNISSEQNLENVAPQSAATPQNDDPDGFFATGPVELPDSATLTKEQCQTMESEAKNNPSLWQKFTNVCKKSYEGAKSLAHAATQFPFDQKK